MKSIWIINGNNIESKHDFNIFLAKYYDRCGRYKKADHIDKMVRLSFHGEYWINDKGYEDANGGVGEYDHEMIAESFLLGVLDLEYLGYGYLSLNDVRDKFDDYINDIDNGDRDVPEEILLYADNLSRIFGKDWVDESGFNDFLEFRKNFLSHDKLGMYDLILEKGLKDPVTFVIEHYGWIRAVIHSQYAVFQLRNFDSNKKEKIESLLEDSVGDTVDPAKYLVNIEIYFPRRSIRLKLEDMDFIKEKMQENRAIMDPVSYPSLSTPNMPSFYGGKEGD